MNWTPFLNVLDNLEGIVAVLAKANNPKYAAVIEAAQAGAQAETESIAAGNAPTVHSTLEDVMAPIVAIGAQKAMENNPDKADVIGALAGAVISGISKPAPDPINSQASI